jgi:energy-coupling factor transport system ATP-binding protein
MPIVARFAKRVVVLGMGNVLVEGSPKQVFSQPEELAKTHIEPPQITQFAQSVTDLGFESSILTVQEMLDQYQKIAEKRGK